MTGPISEQKTPATGFVKLHHKKSGFFRVVHADGAWGGVNNIGIVNLTFYSEHPAIPTSVTYPLDAAGNAINTPTIVGDEGMHREMEISVALALPAALQVRATLDSFIKLAVEEMNKLKQQADNAVKQTESK
jgi:hypothetical protein